MYKSVFLGKEIIFGTYFLGQWIDLTQADDPQAALQLMQKNPFKFIPLFLQTGINTTAEIQGGQTVTLMEVIDEIDKTGGVGSDQIKKIFQTFVDSITTKLGNAKPNPNPATRGRGKK